ncbi:MAG: HAD family hydrolase [Deltaproteobacteria bacterium]|mgnify:CR=1 FL=1|nr:MAG: HAD family hydrolase [Deltaproteobacteria bacterium]
MTLPVKPSLLILDCDGVLVSSREANIAYYNHMLENFGMPLVSPDDAKRVGIFHSHSTKQVIEIFFPESVRGAVMEYAADLDYSEFAALVNPEPGWEDALLKISEKMRICVATNRGHSANALLDAANLATYIDRVFTIHDVKNPKPAPDILKLALDVFDTDAGDALYVGDSELDLKAAQAAAVPFVGFRLEAPLSIGTPAELEVLLR